MPTDWDLIQACRRDDAAAWQTLIARYERLVVAIPLRYGLTSADADDIAQRTFINLLESLNAFHPQSNVKSWLITVARRNSWRVMERYDREQVNPDGDLVDSARALGMATRDDITDWNVIEWLHDGLNALDDRCRRLLTLLYFAPEEPSYVDVARELDMPKNSVGPIRARCLERLRRRLEADDN